MKTVFFSMVLVFAGLSLFAQGNLSSFFDSADAFWQQRVRNGRIDYAAIRQNPDRLTDLRERIATATLEGADAATRQAFYINAYNLLVVGQIVDRYPIASPLDVNGFFDSQRFGVAGQRITLNQLEKDRLLRTFNDPRFHFVLVCGALGCPPIIDRAYRPATLEQQLERQTRRALNDPTFIRVSATGVALSQIFEWYAGDFGGNKAAAVDFINRYRTAPLPAGPVNFYRYDWQLNQTRSAQGLLEAPAASGGGGNNAARYVVSAAIPRGSVELKSFTNLYTQETGMAGGERRDQSSFLTQNLSALYGISNRFNAGIDIKYRQVSFGSAAGSRFDVFSLEQNGATRQQLTGIGPKIRYAPLAALPNFSIQSTYWIATGSDLAGSDARPFIDFNGDVWFTQLFNDFPIGDNFSFFTELDILLEDIGAAENGHINRFSTPVQAIFSYFPNPRTTLYTLGAYSPYWQADFDYFYQAGVGAKYQIHRNLEAEVLLTQFRNSFIRSTNGTASTLNFGLRFSIF